MTNRILLGTRSAGRTGLYVSKPGQDVLTCSDDNLLIDSDVRLPQVVFDTTYSWSSVHHGQPYALRWVTHPDFGFVPLPQIDILSGLFSSGRYIYSPIDMVTYAANTTGFYLWWGSTGNYTDGFNTRDVTIRVRLYSSPDYAPRGNTWSNYDVV